MALASALPTEGFAPISGRAEWQPLRNTATQNKLRQALKVICRQSLLPGSLGAYPKRGWAPSLVACRRWQTVFSVSACAPSRASPSAAAQSLSSASHAWSDPAMQVDLPVMSFRLLSLYRFIASQRLCPMSRQFRPSSISVAGYRASGVRAARPAQPGVRGIPRPRTVGLNAVGVGGRRFNDNRLASLRQHDVLAKR